MSKEKELRRIVLVMGEGEDQMRLHFEITEKAYQRAIELMEKEEGTISHDRRTELFYQAIDEFPDEDQQM
jgi:hypothetical protein